MGQTCWKIWNHNENSQKILNEDIYIREAYQCYTKKEQEQEQQSFIGAELIILKDMYFSFRA